MHVAAGILRDARGRVLIAERLGDSPFAGLWEFPGGKIDAGETPGDALRRELDEELGISVGSFRHLMTVEHQYQDRLVALDFYLVDSWHGRPSGRDGQGLRWVAPAELDESALLPANKEVLQQLRTGSAPRQSCR